MEPVRLVFLLVCLAFTLYPSESNSCEVYKFVSSQNKALEGHMFKTVVHSLVNLCWRDCVWSSWCMSINVRNTTYGTVKCDLNNSSKRAKPGKLVVREGSEYHEMGAVDDHYCRMYQCKRKEDLGDGWYRYGKAVIKLFTEPMKNWTDADVFCNSLGGDLLSVTSSHENDFVFDVFVKGLNLTDEKEIIFPDVQWKFSGYEPGVSFGGTSGGVRYSSDDGENALYFAGNGGFAEVPATPFNLKAFTVTLWMKYLSLSVPFPFLFIGSSSEMKLYIFIDSVGCIAVRTDILSPTYRREDHRICKCPKNTWCHFAFTWNETDGLYRLVLNGINDRQIVLAGLQMRQLTRFVLGLSTPGVTANYFHGFIKHFMLFNKSLSIYEIQTAMYWHEEGVWIGLSDQTNTNVFQWSDGTPVGQVRPLPDYNPQPVLSRRKCIAMGSKRMWIDKHCLEKKSFICKKSEL